MVLILLVILLEHHRHIMSRSENRSFPLEMVLAEAITFAPNPATIACYACLQW